MRIFALLLMVFSLNSYAEEVTHSLINDKFTITLSSEFEQLSQKAINSRYAGQKLPPQAAFSDDKQMATITVLQYPTPADKKSMKKLHKSLSDMLHKANPKTKWKKNKMYTRLGTKVSVFEYENAGLGKYSYHMTYVLPVDGKLTFVNFLVSDKKFKNKWLGLAREGFDTINLL